MPFFVKYNKLTLNYSTTLGIVNFNFHNSYTDREMAGYCAVLPYSAGAKIIISPHALSSRDKIPANPRHTRPLAESAHLFATLRNVWINH